MFLFLKDGMKTCEIRSELLQELVDVGQRIAKEAVIQFNNDGLHIEF